MDDTPPRRLSLPQRRAIACLGIIVFLVVYVVIVSDIGSRLPQVLWAQLLFYGLAGTLWGVPILPLISWSEDYKSKRKKK
jgi:hypothetical protein